MSYELLDDVLTYVIEAWAVFGILFMACGFSIEVLDQNSLANKRIRQRKRIAAETDQVAPEELEQVTALEPLPTDDNDLPVVNMEGIRRLQKKGVPMFPLDEIKTRLNEAGLSLPDDIQLAEHPQARETVLLDDLAQHFTLQNVAPPGKRETQQQLKYA